MLRMRVHQQQKGAHCGGQHGRRNSTDAESGRRGHGLRRVGRAHGRLGRGSGRKCNVAGVTQVRGAEFYGAGF